MEILHPRIRNVRCSWTIYLVIDKTDHIRGEMGRLRVRTFLHTYKYPLTYAYNKVNIQIKYRDPKKRFPRNSGK